MFKLDERFLAELGLDGLPPKGSQALLRKVYEELEMRVGEELTKDMPDQLLDEFGCFVDQDEAATVAWLDANAPDWQTNPNLPNGAQADDKFDHAAMLWLTIHRPDYPAVVEDQLNDLKLELLEHRDVIRANYSQAIIPGNIKP